MILKYININDISEDEYFRALSLMSDERKLSVAKKKNQSDRNLSIAGEMLARECIAEITKQPEENNIPARRTRKAVCNFTRYAF